MKRFLLSGAIIASGLIAHSQVIDVSTLDTSATEINIPRCTSITPFPSSKFKNVQRITFNGIDYLPPSSLCELPALEEVIFNGDNIVIGGAQFFDLPKLKKVVFNGNTIVMNGSTMVGCSPEFETFEINGLVTISEIWDPYECPKFKDYSGNFAMLYNGNSKLIKDNQINEAAANKDYTNTFKKQLEIITGICENYKENLRLADNLMCFDSQLIEYAKAFGVDTTAYSAARDNAKKDEYFWTKLEILQHSPTYSKDSAMYYFSYTPPTDSLLNDTRQRFNLDSIAGNGDDISRIKNLMYWVHDNIRHDGSSDNPRVKLRLHEIYNVCKSQNRGVNCRMLAIVLTEALLSEGIPARYLTCQSKNWDTDNDCHVICVAWSDTLKKWVWIDPTFAAFVTDENGLMLHPGEVRERLIAGAPLFINEDANWNHEWQQSKENYLDYYMAKNLYYITAISHNQPAPEGYPYKYVPTFITLAPTENNYTNSQIITTDDTKFWCEPTR